MDKEMKNIVHVWFLTILSLSYTYFISSQIPKGFYRLVSLLPVFYIFTIIPLYLSSYFFRAISFYTVTWLASFKLLLFAFNQGPLITFQDRRGIIPFILFASLPISIRSSGSQLSKPRKLSLVFELLAYPILMNIIYCYKNHLHLKVVMILYICVMFVGLDILTGVSATFVRVLVGIEFEPASDEPYLSTSLQDFWGRRWNLIVKSTLQHTIYQPVKTACERFLGDDYWSSTLAILVTFAVSGLMHELLLIYVTRNVPTWEMVSFFMLQGVCVVVESCVKRAINSNKYLRLPWMVSTPLTLGFIVASSFWLFFPPVIKRGGDVKLFEEFKVLWDQLWQ